MQFSTNNINKYDNKTSYYKNDTNRNKRFKTVNEDQLLNGLIYQLIPYADYAVEQLMKYTTNKHNYNNKTYTTSNDNNNININNNNKYVNNKNNFVTPTNSPPVLGKLEAADDTDSDYKSFSNMYSNFNISVPSNTNSTNNIIQHQPPPPPKKQLFTPCITPTSSPAKPLPPNYI